MSLGGGDDDPSDPWAVQERFIEENVSGENDNARLGRNHGEDHGMKNTSILASGGGDDPTTGPSNRGFLKVPAKRDQGQMYDNELQILSTEDSILDRDDDPSAMIIKKNPSTTTTTGDMISRGVMSIEPAGRFTISDWMNDNLLVARYGLMASIALLTAYGIARSPLLFRYRTVSEIPAQYFLDRRTLHFRLVAYESCKLNAKRTTLWCRHLSLAERLLAPTGWLKGKPSANNAVGRKDNQHAVHKKDCIPIQLVGVETPEILGADDKATKESSTTAGSLLHFMSTTELETAVTSTTTATTSTNTAGFLNDLVNRPTYVSCQLMARGVATGKVPASTDDANTKKRPIPGHMVNTDTTAGVPPTASIATSEQMAFGKIWYRPKGPFQIFATDLGLQLVERGEAIVATDLYGSNHPGMEIVDNNNHQNSRTNRLRHDASYVAKTLVDGEKTACRQARGVWNNELYRRQRQDFVDDVEFWSQASWPRKFWRWTMTRIRGG
jgi:hypothetical protein